jgi:dihydroorotate dehydrogenase
MAGTYDRLRALLFKMPPESAHRLTIAALRSGLLSRKPPATAPGIAIDLWGLSFPNPLGLAAGFDKNAEVADAALKFGFGFVEVGSITPLPQPGSPPPRLFRLVEDYALINRMGFNNEGQEKVLQRLRGRARAQGILGVNIGANRDSADPIGDYVQGLGAFNALASYLVVNISSPNTPGLRALQSRRHLQELLDRLNAARHGLAAPRPLLLKIAPDLADDEIADIAELALASAVDGLIVSNTTLSRQGLNSPLARETGGLSGAPLFELSTRVLARVYRATGGRLPLIGSGGVSSAETAWQKLRAGASLVQLYTGLVYEGPSLVPAILTGISERLLRSGKTSLREITGSGLADWL